MLIVDDNASTRDILLRRVGALGATGSAADGADADAVLAQAQAAQRGGAPFDLVLLDAALPDRGAETIAARLAAAPGAARPRVVLLTSFSHAEAPPPGTAAGGLVKPVSTASLRDALAAAADSARGEPDGDAPSGFSPDALDLSALRGRRVLLVEDNDINCELALELLSSEGLVVDVAGDGREAIGKIRAQRYDLVLMDCQMPVLDGYAATIELRKDPALDSLPIIAMTANAMERDVDQALEAGMNDHIAKPLDVRAMFEVLLRWLPPARSEWNS